MCKSSGSRKVFKNSNILPADIVETVVPLLIAAVLLAAPATAQQVTFYRDVLPILQNRCQECHRLGQMAPTAFSTYQETRPWAKAIRQAVLTGKMLIEVLEEGRLYYGWRGPDRVGAPQVPKASKANGRKVPVTAGT